MNASGKSLAGGCLCGAVRFTVSAPVQALRACHCTHCQKSSGAGASVNAVLPASAFAITKGAPKHYDDTADSGRILRRFFCGDCGSPLYSHRLATPERVVVRAGAFDDSGGMRITSHIWTKSARPWSYLDPACEQLPGNPA